MLHNHASHSFSTQLAKRFNSIQAAVLIQHFYFWCKKNKENGKHFHDNHWWSYSTVKGLTEYFDYLPPNKIRGAIDLLKEEGFLKTGNYNATKYDRTVWYALTEAGWNLFGQSICENHKCIGENNKSNCGNDESIGEKDISNCEEHESKGENHEYKTDNNPYPYQSSTNPPRKLEEEILKEFGKLEIASSDLTVTKLMQSLQQQSINRARANAPRWDIYQLAEIYVKWLKGKPLPNSLDAAFPAFCLKHTGGKPPKS